MPRHVYSSDIFKGLRKYILFVFELCFQGKSSFWDSHEDIVRSFKLIKTVGRFGVQKILNGYHFEWHTMVSNIEVTNLTNFTFLAIRAAGIFGIFQKVAL